MNTRKRPLERSITIGCIAFIIILCALLGVTSLFAYKQAFYSDYEGYIREILDYTEAHIDHDDMAECARTRVESNKYIETRNFMDTEMEYLDIHYLYILKPMPGEPARILSILSAEDYYNRQNLDGENLWLGYISEEGEYDRETVDLFFEVMNGTEVHFFEEETEWGLDYTGAVSLRDSSGEPYGVLCVDVEISNIRKTIIEHALWSGILILGIGVLFTIMFLVWTKNNISSPIKKLEASVVSFANTSHGQRDVDALVFTDPDIHIGNEVESLAEAVKTMTADMKDYVKDVLAAEEEAYNMKMKAAAMSELANKDALTGIRNKTAYENEVGRLEDGIKNGLKEFGIAMIDLNFLKVINDTYGHEQGNEAIKRLSKIVCNIFDHCPVFRIGGDEFVVILKGVDYTNRETLIEDFKNVIGAVSTDPDAKPWERVSAAIGYSIYDGASDKCVSDVFERADKAMYECKRAMKAERT